LKSLSLNHSGLAKEAVQAIGEGLLKNTKLESLSLRGNLMGLKHIGEFIDSCTLNKRIALRHIDFSSNSLCDEAGAQLAKCFKEMRSLETINLKNNCLENQSGDALLFLVKENP
jgi:Ran GTPase-activating protein (RanGAP) involved in mRNA processing and transport